MYYILVMTIANPRQRRHFLDRNFSIVPKYLAFLRSNSGQEKLEKESPRLL